MTGVHAAIAERAGRPRGWETVAAEELTGLTDNSFEIPVVTDYQSLHLNAVIETDVAGTSSDGDHIELQVRNDVDSAFFTWNSLRSVWSNAATTWNSATETSNASSVTAGAVSRFGPRAVFDIWLHRNGSDWTLIINSSVVMNFAGGVQAARRVTGIGNSGLTSTIAHIELSCLTGANEIQSITYSLEGLRA